MNDIDKILVESLKQIIMQFLIRFIPALGGGILGMIAGFLVGLLAKAIALMIKFGIINARVNSERKNYDEAVEKLKVELEKPEGERNEEEIKKAHEEFKRRLRDLVVIK